MDLLLSAVVSCAEKKPATGAWSENPDLEGSMGSCSMLWQTGQRAKILASRVADISTRMTPECSVELYLVGALAEISMAVVRVFISLPITVLGAAVETFSRVPGDLYPSCCGLAKQKSKSPAAKQN